MMTMKQTVGTLLGSYAIMASSLAATEAWLHIVSLSVGTIGAVVAIIAGVYNIRKLKTELCKDCGKPRVCTVPEKKLPKNCPMRPKNEQATEQVD